MPPSLRLIQDMLKTADGGNVSGSIEISWDAGTTPDGFTLAKGKLVAAIVNGVFSVSLAPGKYTATYFIGALRQKETWVVPASPGPFTIAQIKQ